MIASELPDYPLSGFVQIPRVLRVLRVAPTDSSRRRVRSSFILEHDTASLSFGRSSYVSGSTATEEASMGTPSW